MQKVKVVCLLPRGVVLSGAIGRDLSPLDKGPRQTKNFSDKDAEKKKRHLTKRPEDRVLKVQVVKPSERARMAARRAAPPAEQVAALRAERLLPPSATQWCDLRDRDRQ